MHCINLHFTFASTLSWGTMYRHEVTNKVMLAGSSTSCTNLPSTWVHWPNTTICHENGQCISGSWSVATFTATCYCHTAAEKPGLDGSDMSNYRPVSNLSFISKVVERVVTEQLNEYLAYQRSDATLPVHLSEETFNRNGFAAWVRVWFDMLNAADTPSSSSSLRHL